MPDERQCRDTALRIKSMVGAWTLLGFGPEGWLEMSIIFQNLEGIIFTSPRSPKYPRSSKPVHAGRHRERLLGVQFSLKK